MLVYCVNRNVDNIEGRKIGIIFTVIFLFSKISKREYGGCLKMKRTIIGVLLVALILLGATSTGVSSPVKDARYVKNIACYFEQAKEVLSLKAVVEINETYLREENATVKFFFEGKEINHGLVANDLYYIDCGEETVNYTLDYPVSRLFELKVYDQNGNQIAGGSELVFYKGLVKPEITGVVPEIRSYGGIFGLGEKQDVRIGTVFTNTNENALVFGCGEFDVRGTIWDSEVRVEEGPFSPIKLEPGEDITVYSDWRPYNDQEEPPKVYWDKFVFNPYSEGYWDW